VELLVVKVLPAVFSYEDMKSKWNQDNPDEPYTRRADLETGIYALDNWVIRVDDEQNAISTVGWKEHPSHTVVGGMLATKKGREIGGNNRALQDAREPQLNSSKPIVAAFGHRDGDNSRWMANARRNGWRFSGDEGFDEFKSMLPEQIINQWNSAYPSGNWGIRTVRGKDEFAKCVYEDDVLPVWWNIVKAKPNSMKAISDSQWLTLKERILNDEVPVDRSKYVRYTNLSQINKRMVLYYLKLGFSRPRRRAEAYRGILEEMLRSSNERYDIEDGN
jgi:hypothetical protein